MQLHINHPENEEKKIVAFVRDGGAICHEAALLGETYPLSAEGVCDSRIIACPRSFILEILQDRPNMAMNMLCNLSKQSLAMTRRMGDLLVKSAVARVACYLKEHAPALQSKTYELTLSASKQSVASHLHISQETLSRIFADLKKAGIIEVHGRVITVLDGTRLTLISAGDPIKSHLCPEVCPRCCEEGEDVTSAAS